MKCFGSFGSVFITVVIPILILNSVIVNGEDDNFYKNFDGNRHPELHQHLNLNQDLNQLKEQLQVLTEQMEIMKTMHKTEIADLKHELGNVCKGHYMEGHHRMEAISMGSAKKSIEELRQWMKEMSKNLNNTVVHQVHAIRVELKQALTEASELTQLTRNHEVRLDKMDGDLSKVKYEAQQTRNMLAELRTHVLKIAKEVKAKRDVDVEELYEDRSNEIDEPRPAEPPRHRLRHNRMMHSQLTHLTHAHGQLEEQQINLQAQITDLQHRIDSYKQPDWNLLTAKIDLLELETTVIRKEVKNNTQKMSDFNKIHSSILELREEIENIENKADKTIPEFRKEISKLDISFAQLNAQSSYLKEDQENLRQSVKAIAVSVSNAIDRAEMDRVDLHRLNVSLSELESRSKQHYYRLNDHILKSEANRDANVTESIPLPELMGEVKELQPVEREYVDLVSQLPRDCAAIAGPPGVYLIHPAHDPLDTWCNNRTTLLQRRFNGSIEFNRKFNEYVRGFGDPTSEYWLGLEAMHRITSDNCSSMRIDMTDIYGGNWFAQYEHFSVGSADYGYILEVSGFKGNASDAFEYQNHMEFSAIDRDRDISNTHCAGNYEGGWWFSHCQHVNINGKYTLGLTWFDSDRNEWIAVASSEMRVYRRAGCT